MKQQEMQELIKQHHPNLGETQIRKMLDRAFADFAAKTEILETSSTGDTVVDQRYYALPTTVLQVKGVWINDVNIPRLVPAPIIDDTTDET